MIIVTIVISIGQQSVSEYSKQRLIDTADNSVKTLADAANEVYSEGSGAKKRIFFTVPSGTDADNSGIQGKLVVLRVLESDRFAIANVDITGTLPTTVGTHELWIEAKGGYVTIGAQLVSVNKNSIYVTMDQNGSESDTLKITNNSSSNVDVNIFITWAHSDVTFGLSEANFTLSASEEKTLTLDFNSTALAFGNYAGEIKIAPTINGLQDQNIIIPINAEVGGIQYLVVYPATYSNTVIALAADSNTFRVCNNSSNTLTNVSFSKSGDIASWIEDISTVPSLAAGTCTEKTFTINVPGGTSGAYTGSIIAISGDYSDIIEITLTVVTQVSVFSFSWDTASFNGGGDKLEDWTIENTSATQAITITRMQVWDWNITDADGAIMDKIKLDNTTSWQGTANAGDWVDINPDFAIPAATSYFNKNKLEFDNTVDNDNEYFRITFEFADTSTYTTPIYYSTDLIAPIVLLEAPVVDYNSPSYTVQFDYNVNDASSGIASCSLIVDGVVDQTDTTITEGITQSFSKTFSVDGIYGWDVNCTDDSPQSNAGGSDENRSVIVSFIDIAAPIVLLEAPVVDYNSSSYTVQFDYNVNDVSSGIASCSLIVDGVVDQTDTTITEGITQSFSKTFSVDGIYGWDVNCTDTYVQAYVGSSDENRGITISVPLQSDLFAFDWSTAAFNGGGDKLEDWTIENTSATQAITITRMQVWDWDIMDADGAIMDKIKLDNTTSWQGTANAGDWVDINPDFVIPVSTTYSNKNKLEFDNSVNNDGEYFRITFEFSDSSTYTTIVYP